MLHVLEKMIVRAKEQRLPPEPFVTSADEEVAESHAGESRADGQHRERDQHHHRRFMRRMIAMAMIPMPMTIMRVGQARRPVAALCRRRS